MPALFVEALVPKILSYMCESQVRWGRHFPLPFWPRDTTPES